MLRHKGSQIIHTPRLTLRPYRAGDEIDVFNNWTSDPAVTKYLTWDNHENVETTRLMLDKWLNDYQSGRAYRWGITKSGALIGDINVISWHERDLWCELSYCLGSAWWGRGYMTEALRAVMGYMFMEIGFNRIETTHEIGNHASGRVMQKAGLKREGVNRGRRRLRNGGFSDIVLYGALRDEWI